MIISNSVVHRSDGPAYIDVDNHYEYWVNSKRHRIDGPAVRNQNGSYQWYVNGNDITKEVEEWMKESEITLPFDEDAQTMFNLRFVF